jgi:hypothetical protein
VADDADAPAANDDAGLIYCGVLTPLPLNQDGLIAHISVWPALANHLSDGKVN